MTDLLYNHTTHKRPPPTLVEELTAILTTVPTLQITPAELAVYTVLQRLLRSNWTLNQQASEEYRRWGMFSRWDPMRFEVVRMNPDRDLGYELHGIFKIHTECERRVGELRLEAIVNLISNALHDASKEDAV